MGCGSSLEMGKPPEFGGLPIVKEPSLSTPGKKKKKAKKKRRKKKLEKDVNTTQSAIDLCSEKDLITSPTSNAKSNTEPVVVKSNASPRNTITKSPRTKPDRVDEERLRSSGSTVASVKTKKQRRPLDPNKIERVERWMKLIHFSTLVDPENYIPGDSDDEEAEPEIQNEVNDNDIIDCNMENSDSTFNSVVPIANISQSTAQSPSTCSYQYSNT